MTYLFAALGSLSNGNLIMGQGYTKYNLKLALLTVIIGFPSSFALVSQFGIIGLLVTTIIVGLPSLFLGLRFIKKNFGVSLDWVSSAKILFSSAATGLLTYAAIQLLPLSNPIQLVIGTIIFVIAFLILAVVTRTVNKADLGNIQEIANAMGPLRKPLTFVLSIIEKLLNIVHGE